MNLTQTVTWIPVSERLPQERLAIEYPVAFAMGGASVLTRLDGHWRAYADYGDIYHDNCVTHLRPEPQPAP